MTKPNSSSVINACFSYSSLPFDTTTCIDKNHARPDISPIAEYNLESAKIRKHAVPTAIDDTLGNLLLLGQISLAESYLRSTIRKVINLDKYSMQNVANQGVSYAAALYLEKDMIAESLMESASLASAGTIRRVFDELLGIRGGMPEIKQQLDDFNAICQLRHCIVHRFSYLGSANAVSLGIEDHAHFIEKPIKLDYAKLQEAFQVIDVCVRSVNNCLFTRLVYRLADNGVWKWYYASDYHTFKKYYDLFVDPSESGNLSRRAAYADLVKEKKPAPKQKKKK